MDKIRLRSYKRKERKGKGIKKVRARRIEKEFSNECGIKYKTIWTGEKKGEKIGRENLNLTIKSLFKSTQIALEFDLNQKMDSKITIRWFDVRKKHTNTQKKCWLECF
ncbi:hypothetical protein NH340_JMT06097 [Sarcoptes scabiei]|nr:hypothetical protein NH340_JMT06097 [Sarcoptes scabiei]